MNVNPWHHTTLLLQFFSVNHRTIDTMIIIKSNSTKGKRNGTMAWYVLCANTHHSKVIAHTQCYRTLTSFTLCTEFYLVLYANMYQQATQMETHGVSGREAANEFLFYALNKKWIQRVCGVMGYGMTGVKIRWQEKSVDSLLVVV